MRLYGVHVAGINLLETIPVSPAVLAAMEMAAAEVLVLQVVPVAQVTLDRLHPLFVKLLLGVPEAMQVLPVMAVLAEIKVVAEVAVIDKVRALHHQLV
jgi:hypothetical protein